MAPRALIATVAVCGLLLLWGLHNPIFSFDLPQRHRISELDLTVSFPDGALNFSSPYDHLGWYESPVARDFCASHGFSVFKPQAKTSQRKVYDLIMVNSEVDMLELRLATMYDYVDYFIVVESTRTFQGRHKDLTIRDNWDRFTQYHDKIIYHKLDIPDGFSPSVTWEYENLQRNAMYEQVFPKLKKEQAPVNGDVILVSDVDEMLRPITLLVLRTCNFPRRLTLSTKLYYYGFQYLHRGAEWPFPHATFYDGSRTITPNELRNNDGGNLAVRLMQRATLSNAGWHCTNCFGTVDDLLHKMGSTSYMWMNEKVYQDRDHIADAVRDGRDIWGRPEHTFQRIQKNRDVPRFLLEKGAARLRYMVNRDGDSAGFGDYP